MFATTDKTITTNFTPLVNVLTQRLKFSSLINS